jgi:hypothetical protein
VTGSRAAGARSWWSRCGTGGADREDAPATVVTETVIASHHQFSRSTSRDYSDVALDET